MQENNEEMLKKYIESIESTEIFTKGYDEESLCYDLDQSNLDEDFEELSKTLYEDNLQLSKEQLAEIKQVYVDSKKWFYSNFFSGYKNYFIFF